MEAAKIIKQVRSEGLTYRDISKLVGVSHVYLFQAENGQRKPGPKIQEAVRILKIFSK